MGLSLVTASGGCSLVVVCRLLTAVLLLLRSMGSRACGLRSCGTRAQWLHFSVSRARFSSCGARALLFHGMWNHSRPRIEPMSPALAGGFFTTKPPGKPLFLNFLMDSFKKCCITDVLGDAESGIL